MEVHTATTAEPGEQSPRDTYGEQSQGVPEPLSLEWDTDELLRNSRPASPTQFRTDRSASRGLLVYSPRRRRAGPTLPQPGRPPQCRPPTRRRSPTPWRTWTTRRVRPRRWLGPARTSGRHPDLNGPERGYVRGRVGDSSGPPVWARRDLPEPTLGLAVAPTPAERRGAGRPTRRASAGLLRRTSARAPGGTRTPTRGCERSRRQGSSTGSDAKSDSRPPAARRATPVPVGRRW